MITYVVRRVFQNLVLIFLAGLLIYTTLVIIMPRSPAIQYNNLRRIPPSELVEPFKGMLEDLEQRYKLDKPWPINFFVWLFDPSVTESEEYDLSGNLVRNPKGLTVNIFGISIRGSGILTGDFGRTDYFGSGTPIRDVFEDRWLNTFVLLLAALVLTLLIGLPVGIYGAVRQRSTVDHLFTAFTLGGLSIPPFLLGLLFIIIFAVIPKTLHDQNGWSWLPWLPPGSVGERGNFWNSVNHLVLPAVTLAIPQIAWLSRYTRFAMLDVLRQDYVRTAWAKGLSARRVVFKHALRNTLIPMVTQLALLLPTLTSGAIVIETVFAYEGMGRAFFSALGGCLVSSTMLFWQDPRPCPWSGYWPIDTPLALVLLLILLLIIALSNLLADLFYVVVDPRISYASDRQRT